MTGLGVVVRCFVGASDYTEPRCAKTPAGHGVEIRLDYTVSRMHEVANKI